MSRAVSTSRPLRALSSFLIWGIASCGISVRVVEERSTGDGGGGPGSGLGAGGMLPSLAGGPGAVSAGRGAEPPDSGPGGAPGLHVKFPPFGGSYCSFSEVGDAGATSEDDSGSGGACAVDCLQSVMKVDGVPSAMLVQGGQLFWESETAGGIFGMRDGDLGGAYFETHEPDIRALAVDDQYLYFASHQSGAIDRMRRVYDNLVEPLADAQAGVSALVVDHENLYFAADNGLGEVKSLALGKRVGHLNAETEGAVIAMALDATDLFVQNVFSIIKIGKCNYGQQQTMLATSHHGDGLVLDEMHVYFVTDGQVLRVPKQGGDAVTLYSGGSASSVAVEGAYAYFGTATGEIMRVPVEGGAIATLVSGQASPRIFGIDRHRLYWISTPGPNVISSLRL